MITSHALRHAHDSILLLHGLDIQYVAYRLGDTSQVVSEVYVHILAKMKEKGDQKASQISELLYVYIRDTILPIYHTSKSTYKYQFIVLLRRKRKSCIYYNLLI